MAAMKNKMSSRERMLAALKQEEVDRFPVWLKASEQFNIECGCDLLERNGVCCKQSKSGVEVEETHTDTRATRVWHTPDGDLTGIDGLMPDGSHPVKFAIENRDDLAAARWIYRDTEYESADLEAIDKSRMKQDEIIRKDRISQNGTGPSPYMHLIQHMAGPESTVYLQTDEPELFSELLDLMHQDKIRQLTALLPGMIVDTYWLTENTTTTLLSPAIFQKYCMPYLRDYGQLILDHDLIPIHHMCGTLSALLEDIDTLPAVVNEAFTTYPVGDVSIADGRSRMPSKALMGGTNAALWLEDADTIIEAVAEDLAGCPNTRGIFLTSAGVLPPAVTVEKAKKVVAAFQEM